MKATECPICKKYCSNPKKMGSRYHCEYCGAYLGADVPKEKRLLPQTWWRDREGNMRRWVEKFVKEHGDKKKVSAYQGDPE